MEISRVDTDMQSQPITFWIVCGIAKEENAGRAFATDQGSDRCFVTSDPTLWIMKIP